MRVRHARGEYEVRFCPLADALADLGPAPWTITDEKVAAALAPVLPEGGERIAVGPGERSKSLATYERCVRWLSDQGADRNATIIALGGGVVGDLAGFVAATYMRGVRLIQIPTSLMAQVDSAIGGKVALDLQQGKNLIGSFHAPAEVRIAVEALATLEPRHFVNGMAEVLKYGFILEPHLVEVCLRDTLHAGHAELEAIVRRCVELKAHVVQEDEFEVAGTRAILNFGHTIGHAVEAATGYGPILHGEAVAIGMVVEAVLG
ncbi:MAG: 3-dehydroquinate synthase, partial [Fimbriimonas ginsengisoli]|nr:3-dehydroquinate synthase [Fimbriimonas ginsengisoli]